MVDKNKILELIPVLSYNDQIDRESLDLTIRNIMALTSQYGAVTLCLSDMRRVLDRNGKEDYIRFNTLRRCLPYVLDRDIREASKLIEHFIF
jgi:hypothetical protein